MNLGCRLWSGGRFALTTMGLNCFTTCQCTSTVDVPRCVRCTSLILAYWGTNKMADRLQIYFQICLFLLQSIYLYLNFTGGFIKGPTDNKSLFCQEMACRWQGRSHYHLWPILWRKYALSLFDVKNVIIMDSVNQCFKRLLCTGWLIFNSFINVNVLMKSCGDKVMLIGFCDVEVHFRHNERDGVSKQQIFYSTVYSGADQRKHQSSASLAFVRGIHRDRWILHTMGQ